MKTIFTSLIIGLALSANATIHTIGVGSGGLNFSPNTLSVAVGDTVRFTYVTGFHNTTSSSVPSGADTWSAPMQSAGSFDYIVKVAGDYAYKCTFHGGMTGTFTATVTGLNDNTLIQAKSIGIAPNPTAGQSDLRFTSGNTFDGAIKIFNTTGNLLLEKNVFVISGENQFSLNTETLPSGIYIVNLFDKKSAIISERLIKQ